MTTNMARKAAKNRPSTMLPHNVIGGAVTCSTVTASVAATGRSASAAGEVSSTNYRTNMDSLSRSFDIVTPQTRAITDDKTAASMNELGSFEPKVARIAMAVVGMS